MTGESRFGLPPHAVEKICSVFQAWPQVERVTLYGSRAKGSYRPESDIDLTIDGEGLALEQLLAMESQIDELLLPWMVDLSLRARIENPALLEHIARVGVPFYERPAGSRGNHRGMADS